MYLRRLDGDYWLRKSRSGDNFKCLKCSFVSLLKSQCPECRGMFIGPHLCSWERQHSWCHPDIIQYRTSCFLLDKSHLHFVDLCSKFYLVGILMWVYMFPTVLTVFIDSHVMLSLRGIHIQDCVTAPQLRASKLVPRYLKHGLWTMVGHSIPAQQKIPLWEICDFPQYISCISQPHCLLPRGPYPATATSSHAQ